MAIKYDEIVPWGRNFDEYCRMFDLRDGDLKKRILGCGDGTASFNRICNSNGGNVVSVDPIYDLTKECVSQRIKTTFENVITQTRQNQDKFRWNTIKSVDELGKIRMNAMMQFLENYEQGKAQGKYIAGSLPSLDFPDNSFDIALSSHFLFLYSDNLTYEFHYNSICEMLRISSEVRIFPLVDVNSNKSTYVSRIVDDLNDYNIEIRKVNYEFQINGNELMTISKKNGRLKI
jgi:SAM-dependent methyltransferase